jgi:prephenate dehydrogenase
LGKSFFLTGEAQGDSVDAYEEMLEAIGAKIVRANAQEHDRIVAKSSHMPQMTAVLLSLLLEGERNAEPYIGSGFRDSTRIAGGDPRVWRDIFRYNAEEMMQNVDALQDQLDRVKIYLETDDGEGLYHMLEAANAVQERIKE